MRSHVKAGNTILLNDCVVARSFWERFLGLMGKRFMLPTEAILFPRCNSIHTFFMRFPIDVVLIDKNGRVAEIVPSLRPWRCLWPRRGVAHVLELASGQAKRIGFVPGLTIEMEGAW